MITRTLITSILSIFIINSFAFAEVIEINVHTRSEPKAALGIFFASGKVVQQADTSFERINEDTIAVKLPYDLKSLPSASPFATAYLITEDDEIIFGDIRMVSLSDSSESFLKTPICPVEITEPKANMLLTEQFTYLESLLDIRNKKREVARKVISDKLNPSLITRLQKLENSFGLKYYTPLSADRPAIELMERISKIKDIIKNYQSSQETSQ